MRPSRPWFRASKNAWYVQLNGSQRSLGQHPHGYPKPKKSEKTGLWNAPEPIRDALDSLLKGEPVRPATPQTLTVQSLCDKFLVFAEAHNEAKDFKTYKSFLQCLCDFVPDTCGRNVGVLAAADITPAIVTGWLDAHPKWKGARRHAVMAAKRAYRWADVHAKILSPNPLRGLKNSRAMSRARFLTADQRKKVLALIPDWQFRFFVEAMQESGCRPSEVRRVCAEDVDLELGIWRLRRHKTANKTGRARIVYLTPRLLEITKELLGKNPAGTLFRGPRFNRPFGMHGICTRFQRLRKKLEKKHPKEDFSALCAYAYRHSVADAAIKKGVSVEQTAVLLGTSPDMIHHHYQHAAADVAYMRELAAKATGA